MIVLPWRVKPEVDERMLKIHLNRIATRSGISDDFVTQIPISVLRYIEDEGINGELIPLPDSALPGQVWIRVIKPCI